MEKPSSAAPTVGELDSVALLYDGDCPVCTLYGCSIDVADEAGSLRRVDARGDDALVRAATRPAMISMMA